MFSPLYYGILLATSVVAIVIFILALERLSIKTGSNNAAKDGCSANSPRSRS